MMFGKAVISSNRSSMPEVVGCDEALFDPFDEPEMTAIIERLLTDDAFRTRLESNAPKRLAAFTWERSAQLALAFLEASVARVPKPRNSARTHVAHALARVRNDKRLEGFPHDIAIRHIARTFRRAERRQLLIDVSRLVVHDARTGIQRVVRSILLSLLRNPPEGFVVEPVHANATETGYRYARRFADTFLGVTHPWHEDQPVEVWSGDVMCVLDLEPDVLVRQRETLDDWRLRGVEVFTVVHDILPVLLPEYFPDSVGEKVIGRWVRELARHNGAICVSQTVASQLRGWIGAQGIETHPRFRYDWFHHGSEIGTPGSSQSLPSDAKALLVTLASRPTALMVGTIEPRKGHAQALAAFEQLWAEGQDVALAIVGKQGWRVEGFARKLLIHPELGKRLFWLDGISDAYLDRVYDSATVLLGASEGEGFGLPLIEAARKGLPLLLRDIPVFREVAGQGANYFANSRSPDVIANAIRGWLEKYREGSQASPDKVDWLTWDQSAQMLFSRLVRPSTTSNLVHSHRIE
jgi:glycosyltransferase involved in cell wall biosynthesis